MQLACDGLFLCHDVRDSFVPLLRHVLEKKRIGVALGPIYEKDPAEELLFPFIRADVETGWSSRPCEPDGIPEHVLTRARELRQGWLDTWFESAPWMYNADRELDCLNQWARAGLVLEICRRRGVNVRGLGTAHVNWRLRGTVTGRFGASQWGSSHTWPNGFNPLTIPEADRHLIVPSAAGRIVCVIDFKAIDVCSMTSLLPGMWLRYEDATDLHTRTAEILFGYSTPEFRARAKGEIFVHAYGGNSELKELFLERLPELNPTRALPHGEFPRRVQSVSAEAFRAGLSNALPLLLAEDVMPMFTVHDELVLDIDEGSVDRAIDVANAMQEGATARVGVTYTTSVGLGLDYGKAKE